MNKTYSLCSFSGLVEKSDKILLPGLLLMLTACAQGDFQSGEGSLSLPLSQALGVQMLPESVNTEGRVEIFPLYLKIPLEIENGVASARFKGLPAGSYTLRIVFEVTDTGFGRFTVAEAVREIEIGDSPGRLSFQKTDYSYPDKDGDQYSNLTEIKHGTDPATPLDKPNTARMFITTASGSGDLSSWPDAGGKNGISAGDAICQASADAAGLPGVFVAWLSDVNHDAYCRVHGLSGRKSNNCGQDVLPEYAGPWVRSDGFPFSPGINKLVEQGIVYSPVIIDEFGRNIAGGTTLFAPLLWTGTTERGEISKEQEKLLSCGNWASDDPGSLGESGIPGSGGYTWTSRFKTTCDNRGHLVCFESSGGIPLPLFKTKGKMVFVTSVSGSGNLASWPDAGSNTGIAAGDAVCRSRARAGGFSNPQRFKAWLSSSTVDAIDRLFSDGPWVRPDGVMVAENRSDLVDNNGIFTSISVDENLHYFTEYPEHTSDDAWTGTDSRGRGEGMQHCNDWTTGSQQDFGGAGTATQALQYWSGRLVNESFGPQPAFEPDCSTLLRLFCFED